VSAGVAGLLDAVRRYDDWEGVAFRSFAHSRIRGAMIDLLRKNGQKDMKANRDWRAYVSSGEAVRPRDRALPRELRNECALAVRPVQFHDMHAAELAELLPAALEVLEPLERRVIELVYFEDYKLIHAAAALGKSKPWIGRLHSRALDKMRAAIEGDAMAA
jgi:RNA polymerase sigma factor (sigma-70 family)